MEWLLVIVAGLIEVGFTTCLGQAKASAGNTALAWYAGFFLCLMASMALLMKAVETLPIGTAYAVWTGIGALGAVLVGIFFFREPADFWRLFFLATLVLSIVGLKSVSH
ncbi:MAG: DMT family transporter [Spirochaetota bacterium]